MDSAIRFYEMITGVQVVSRKDTPCTSAILGRDNAQIALVENGGDLGLERCFFIFDTFVLEAEDSAAQGG